MAKDTTDNSFSSDVLEGKNVVLVDFWAPWCGPCRQLSPIIDELSKELEGKMDIYKINIDENPEIPSKYSVRGIPTLMIFKNGKVVDTKVGSLPRNTLHEWVKNNL